MIKPIEHNMIKRIAKFFKPTKILDATLIHQPTYSKIIINKTREKLEIILPPCKFDSGCILFMLFYTALIVLPLYPFIVLTKEQSFKPSITGFLVAIVCFGPFAWTGICGLSEIIFSFIGTRRITIDEYKISLSSKIFDFNYRERLRSHRLSITGVFLSTISDFNYDIREYFTYQELNIYTDSNEDKKFSLDFNLDAMEREWLAQELAAWLKLPITRNSITRN
jgi:hypothetical protein